MMAKTVCDLCDEAANPANFGGLCDTCEAKRQARVERNRKVLRSHGHQHTEFGRAIHA